MTTEIKSYSLSLPDGSIKIGKTITTYNESGAEVSIEEYYGATAEEWLESVGLGANRQPTLLYLRQAGVVSPRLDATEQYLNTVLAMFAQDPSPRSDWPLPEYPFESVVAEAVAGLRVV